MPPELRTPRSSSRQVKHIEQKRQLLEEPDLIAPLVANLTQLLRDELNQLDKEYRERHKQGMERLKTDANWQQLEPEQRNKLLAEQKLTLADQPEVKLGSTDEVLQTLEQVNLSMFADRVAAMPARFDNVAAGAAEIAVNRKPSSSRCHAAPSRPWKRSMPG